MPKKKEKGEKEQTKKKEKDENEDKSEKEKGDGEDSEKAEKKDKKGKDKKEKRKSAPAATSKTDADTDKRRRSNGFEVELDPHAQQPTEEDLKRFGPLSLEARQARTAIVLLESEEEHVLIESLDSLQRFCSRRLENWEMFVILQGVTGIWKFFHHEHLVIQRLALKILAIISNLHSVKLICRDREVAKDLATLLQQNDDVVVEYATVIAKNLSTLYTGRIEVFQNECVPRLLAKTQHTDPDIRQNTLESIFYLIDEPLHGDIFETADTVSIIFNSIDSEFPRIQINALSIFEKLSRMPNGVAALLEMDLIENMKKKLADPDLGDLHRICLRILLNIASNTTNCQKMSGLMPEFTGLMDSSQDLKVLILTITLLGKMARIPALTKALINNDVIPKLINVVVIHADTEIRQAATHTAAQIAATDLKAKQLLVEIFKPLREFFNDDRITSEAAEFILLAFSIILEEGDYAIYHFLELDGLKIISKVLKGRGDGNYTENTVLTSLTCVNIIGTYHHFRKEIVEEGLVPEIVKLIGSLNHHVVALAANALCSLLCVDKGREEFLANEGCNFLITAVKNPELNVVISVTPLINAIGSYKEIATELVNKGLLSTMWERPDFLSRNGPLRVCMKRLISSHFQAKFAYTSHIGPYEKLPQGFYDVGYLKKTDKFVPLEDLTYEDRDNHHKIIYVNLDNYVNPTVFQNNPIMRVLQSEETSTILSIAAQIRNLIPENVRSEKDLVGLVATVVCAKMGGTIDKWRVSAQSEEIELANLQSKHESIAVPLTIMTNGAHRPRALMFKALADIFGIPASLDRGGFKKCWNVVLIRAKRMHSCCPCPQNPDEEPTTFYTERLRRFVVDLLYAPGSLFPLYSYEADTYCFC